MRKFIALVLITAAFGCRNIASRTSSAEKHVAAVAQPVEASAAPVATRMIIRTANISMVVDDTAASIERITAAAESVGGYVSDSRVWRDGEQLRGTVTLRIPSDRLSAALAVIRKMAVRIQSESLGSQEVTQEYVDLASQLRNAEAAETELRQLMTTVRRNSKKASEVLAIYQELTSIRAQIEQTKGRMQYLSQMTALASVQVDLVPNALAKPVVEPGWQPLVIVKDASRALVHALQGLASIAIWVAIDAVPILTILGLIAFIAWRGINAAWKTRKPASS